MKNQSFKLLFILLMLIGAEGIAAPHKFDTTGFRHKFFSLSKIFSEEVKPYFRKFAEQQLPPAEKNLDEWGRSNRELLIRSKSSIWEQKSDFTLQSTYKYYLKSDEPKQPDGEQLLNLLISVYETEFPGLDASFFDKVRKRAAKL